MSFLEDAWQSETGLVLADVERLYTPLSHISIPGLDEL